jgi:hypothetical protein
MNSAVRFSVFLALIASVAPMALHADSITITAAGRGMQISETVTMIADPKDAGVFEATGITGEVNGVRITGLMAGSDNVNAPTYNGNDTFSFDNLFYSSSPNLDIQGLGFDIGTSGYQGNLYFENGSYKLADSNRNVTTLSSYEADTVAAAPKADTVAAAPEPSSLPLFGTGVIILFLASAVRTKGLMA